MRSQSPTRSRVAQNAAGGSLVLQPEEKRRAAAVRGAPGQPARRSGVSRDRHILLGVSHPSNDPALHRTFEVHAAYDGALGGWLARFGEKNANDQLETGGSHLMDGDRPRRFSSAAACLGSAVTSIITMVEREADD